MRLPRAVYAEPKSSLLDEDADCRRGTRSIFLLIRKECGSILSLMGSPVGAGGFALGEGKQMTKGNRCVRPAPLVSATRALMVAAIVGVLTAGPAASIAVADTPAQFIYRVSH